MGLVALQHVGSSRTRARTRVPCIGRRILNHCTTREALPYTFKPSDSFLFHPGLSLDGASAGQDPSHCPGGLLLIYACGFMMKEFLFLSLPWAVLPNVPIAICQNPGRGGGGNFSDPRKIEGVRKVGTETLIPPCKCTKLCSGSFLYFDSLFSCASLWREDLSHSPPFYNWGNGAEWLCISPIVTQPRRAQANLELKCVFPKVFLATLFFHPDSSAAVSGCVCWSSGHLLWEVKGGSLGERVGGEIWGGRRNRATVEPDTILLSLLPPASQETVRVFWMGELGAGSTGQCIAVESVGFHQQTF